MKKILIPLTLLSVISGLIFSGSLPEFSLKKIDGSLYSSSEHTGSRVILIEFWATWCKPCKKLLKELEEIRKEFGDRLIVLAVSTDESSSFSRIENFIKSRGYGFTVLLDPDSEVSGKFNPSASVPYTLIINRNKDIVFTHTGYLPGFEKKIREKLIETLRE